MRLPELLSSFDSATKRIPLHEITRWLEHLSISFDEVDQHACFAAETYRRNLLKEGSHYHALLLCWKAGQRSPIHDHTGSACGVLVLRGRATETLFERTEEGLIYATASRTLDEGMICGSEDSDIHQISNLQPNGSELVTLHIYSPPLFKMNTYSLIDRTVRVVDEPVYSFTHGAGI